ncbi:glycosyltransferase family 2 protein [Ferrimonas futtsuensis]|uniref:glycosyltransferase family 2 protein n=1 Tax=Ferrimonas futtsuensis TaxID=364764 RepID=UPI0006845563|nr:glycosyltransferase family A protein [Ferrimonas futtsuensis]
MEPSICVVIPSHNCLNFLPLALASVWTQSLPAREVWVVDDGSDDGTTEWLQRQKMIHPRLHSLRLEGVGCSAARNAAIALTQCDWVAFLDADDTWRPDKLRQQWQALANRPEAAMCFTNYMHVKPDGESIIDCFSFWPDFRRYAPVLPNYITPQQLLAENVVGTSTVMARRQAIEAVGGFDTRLASASDWELWLKIAKAYPTIALPDCHCDYLMRPGSISMARLKRLNAMTEILKRHKTDFGQHPAAIHSAVARINLGYAEWYQEQREFGRALMYQLKALWNRYDERGVKRVGRLMIQMVSSRP